MLGNFVKNYTLLKLPTSKRVAGWGQHAQKSTGWFSSQKIEQKNHRNQKHPGPKRGLATFDFQLARQFQLTKVVNEVFRIIRIKFAISISYGFQFLSCIFNICCIYIYIFVYNNANLGHPKVIAPKLHPWRVIWVHSYIMFKTPKGLVTRGDMGEESHTSQLDNQYLVENIYSTCREE